MHGNESRTLGRTATIGLGAAAAWFSLLVFAQPALAIPVFARKYRTSCTTCHAGFPKLNSDGEAFRRNGYQFPADEDLLVKDEPIPMGNEAYRDLWPNSIWPSDIPNLPPVAFRARMGYKQFLNTPAGDPSGDFQFPMDYSLLTAGTFGENISWYAGFVLAGRGGHGGGGGGHDAEEAAGLEPELERLFVQFSNLFAWSPYEDDDGMRAGNRWMILPPRFLNLRVGQFEPQVVAPWGSIHRQLGITGRLPNVATLGSNGFMLEPAQRGFELHGLWRQYNSYAVGMVNGNNAMTAWDNNTHKDFYFRVARKWWGAPIDGVLGVADSGENGEGEVADPGDALAPSLDFWREVSGETGFFGYFGRNTVAAEEEEEIIFHGVEHGHVEHMHMRLNDFDRIGFDARTQWQDLDIFGAFIWGWDEDVGGEKAEIEPDTLFTWFVEADYVFKPWLTGYVRYEELEFGDGHRQEHDRINRAVVGAVFTIRANMRVVTEFTLDAKGANDEGEFTTHDVWTTMLDFAF